MHKLKLVLAGSSTISLEQYRLVFASDVVIVVLRLIFLNMFNFNI